MRISIVLLILSTVSLMPLIARLTMTPCIIAGQSLVKILEGFRESITNKDNHSRD